MRNQKINTHLNNIKFLNNAEMVLVLLAFFRNLELLIWSSALIFRDLLLKQRHDNIYL
jgi:hypothetical protein